MIRLISLAATILVATLSGCASDPAPETEPAAQPAAAAPAALAFMAPLAVAALPNTGHESFLEVSPDGQTMLTCAHGDFREPVHKFASTDGGLTFTKLDSGPALPAGDCDVAMGPDGAWSFAGKTDVGIDVVTTTDGGATWVGNRLAGPPLNGLADRQWLAYVGETLLLSYQPGTQEVGSVLLVRSTDLGATWSDPVEVLPFDPARPVVAVGDFLVGPGPNEVRIPALRAPLGAPTGNDPGARLFFLVSHDTGTTWTEQAVGVVGGSPYPTGAAITPQGVIAWAVVDGEDLKVLVSRDAGATWAEPFTVATGIGWDRPWASARPDGTVDVVWLAEGEDFDRPARGLALARIDPMAAAPVLARTIVADVDFIEFAAVAHDASGRAHVAVIDGPSLIVQQEVGTAGTLFLVHEARPVTDA